MTRLAPVCTNCGATDFVWANDLKTGGLGGGSLSLRNRGELSLGTRICRACGHADLFLKDPSILKMPHTWKPGEFTPITPRASAPLSHHGSRPETPTPTTPVAPTPYVPPPAAPVPPAPSATPTPSGPASSMPAPAETPPSPHAVPDAPPPMAAPPPPPPPPEDGGRKPGRRRGSKSKGGDPTAPPPPP